MSLTKYLSVADNARDAVLLHVSDSSERQEWRDKTGLMTTTTAHQILNTLMSMDASLHLIEHCIWVLRLT
jgi:hypothetical protein